MPLIVFEGIDGCGKTTQLDLLKARLESEGIPYQQFREPGGTRTGERLRELLLDPASHVTPVAELFGYLLSRAQLVEECLRPALAAGELVLLDRFYHSTLVYQSFGLGLDRAQVQAAIELAVAGVHPDLTLWFDVDPEKTFLRRNSGRDTEDRIESRGPDYLRKVHQGYATLAEEKRVVRVDGGGSKDRIAMEVWGLVEPLLPPR